MGLDIGIASVGFGVIDDNFKIIDTGVRLFESGNSAKNVERRGFRQGRRIKRWRNHRILRVEKFLELYGIKSSDNYLEDVLSLKIKGLTDKLELCELYIVLTNYVKTRDISYLDDLVIGNEKNSSNYKESLNENVKKLETMLPWQIQKELISLINIVVIYRTKILYIEIFSLQEAIKKKLKKSLIIMQNIMILLTMNL